MISWFLIVFASLQEHLFPFLENIWWYMMFLTYCLEQIHAQWYQGQALFTKNKINQMIYIHLFKKIPFVMDHCKEDYILNSVSNKKLKCFVNTTKILPCWSTHGCENGGICLFVWSIWQHCFGDKNLLGKVWLKPFSQMCGTFPGKITKYCAGQDHYWQEKMCRNHLKWASDWLSWKWKIKLIWPSPTSQTQLSIK